jgi:[acyl-carrier-protein] S-malonyltransferase
MAALLGADPEVAGTIASAAAEGEVCAVANDNAPGQVVLSGAREAVERAIAMAPEHGIKRALKLPVSAPFHCALMRPAADAMAEALEGVAINAPSVPVFANVSAAPVSDVGALRPLLVEQVTAMVRWRESIIAMRTEGIESVVEVGAGKVLSGLVKRIDREMTATSVGQVADVEAFLKEL